MMLGVVPPEPARPARAQPTSSDWWTRPRSARTAGDEGEPGLEAPRESFLVFARRALSFIAPQKKCSALGTPTQPPFRERVRHGTAVRKVSRGLLRRGTSLGEGDASSAKMSESSYLRDAERHRARVERRTGSRPGRRPVGIRRPDARSPGPRRRSQAKWPERRSTFCAPQRPDGALTPRHRPYPLEGARLPDLLHRKFHERRHLEWHKSLVCVHDLNGRAAGAPAFEHRDQASRIQL